MNPISHLSNINRRVLLSTLALLPILPPRIAAAQQTSPADSRAFSFAELHALARAHAGYRLHEQLTGRVGRIAPAGLEQLCPDWRERETFLCGPARLLAAMRGRWEHDGDPGRLHTEHFQPDTELGSREHGAGGTIRFCASDIEACSDGTQPILVAGESAGATLAHGCRMGICHSCVGRLRSGRVRDLRTGRVHGQAGEAVRICINAPEGPVEIDL